MSEISLKKIRKKLASAVHSYGIFKPARFCMEESIALTAWNSDVGRERLLVTPYNQDFFQLAHTYQAQKNPFYCGVASSVTVLNALRLAKGNIPSQETLHYEHFEPETGEVERIAYRAYSQLTLLDEETDRLIKPRSIIAPNKEGLAAPGEKPLNPGLVLDQVKQILEIYKTQTDLYYAHDDIETGINELRDLLKQELLKKDSFIIANFDGQTIGTETGGHFSTIGAYHPTSDSVLVLDAALHKAPWYWVDVHHLYFAMNTRDGEHKRGYLVVSDADEE